MSLPKPELAAADSQSHPTSIDPSSVSQSPDAHKAHKESRSQNGVQSLEIGLTVLDVLIDQSHPMMLKDIAAAMQMPAAKAHRYLVSLIRKGYARQLEDGRYALGARVDFLGTLGHSGLNQHNMLQRLAIAANAIKEALNCAVQIAKWVDGIPIIIQSVEPDRPISIVTRIGSKMPLTTSATGQLFASYQSAALIEPLVKAEWQKTTDSQANDKPSSVSLEDIDQRWQKFLDQCDQIRLQGYAMVSGDMMPGVHAIAIPVKPTFLANGFQTLSVSQAKSDQGDVTCDLSSSHSSKGSSPLPNSSLSNSSLTNSPLIASIASDSARSLDYAITVIGTEAQLPLHKKQALVERILDIAQRHQIG